MKLFTFLLSLISLATLVFSHFATLSGPLFSRGCNKYFLGARFAYLLSRAWPQAHCSNSGPHQGAEQALPLGLPFCLPGRQPTVSPHSLCCPAGRHGPESQERSLSAPSSPSLSLSARSACTAEALALPLICSGSARDLPHSLAAVGHHPWGHSDVLLFLLCLTFLTSSSQQVTTLCH